ncbi:hypothetical protein KSP40_PGU006437 [Platanthera guangdongensis]|uniref:Uncharacterized protein n=1 Tax=Platanthera guangdongensis TaxID=2320717 RepID=A0ABR2MJB7_9ASPA
MASLICIFSLFCSSPLHRSSSLVDSLLLAVRVLIHCSYKLAADYHLIREINIDKISEWKPFFKARQHRGMLLLMPPNNQFENEHETINESHGIEVFKLGFEVYADGSTRVLRLCESTRLEQIASQPSASFQLLLSSFAVHFLGKNKQSFTVDEKWQGAPFASMIRRSQLHGSGINMNILQLVFNLQNANSKIKQVKYSSIIIQPIDLKIDEETLMKLVPFWRSSNSNSREPSRQFYFKQFEIHPVKIIASFLPGNQYPSYSSAQETLRSFLHSVLKVPSISNVVLELNGVLLTHTVVTSRELLIKCAQHYSWYLIRAVYIAKGSSLLPPAFSSIFDDTASSSLDVFFDPSDGSISLPGLTLDATKVGDVVRLSKLVQIQRGLEVVAGSLIQGRLRRDFMRLVKEEAFDNLKCR